MVSSPLRALAFRRDLDTLLQEGFDGADYISQQEVLSLVGEVCIFSSFFFNEVQSDVPQVTPEVVSGQVNTNPDFGNDTEFPLGFPVSASGWVFKPRRKRDPQLAKFFYELFLVVSELGRNEKPTEVRIQLQEELSRRLSRKIAKVGRSVARTFDATESGQAETLSSLERALLDAFPQLAKQVREDSEDIKRKKSRSYYSRRKRR